MSSSSFDYEKALYQLRALLTAPVASSQQLFSMLVEIDRYEQHLTADKQQLKHIVALNRHSETLRLLLEECRHIQNWAQNNNFNFYSNGERTLLVHLAAYGIQTIFDVGANIGEWSLLAQQIVPQAKIHCFEIIPETCEKLKSRALPSMVVNGGLSNVEGIVRVKHYPQASSFSSRYDYPHTFEHIALEAKVTTGDLYLEKHGIAHVDLLKIDVEGMEGMVLQGFEKAFASKRVSAVQFEYGYVNILSKFLLKDFYDFFESYGYRVGKIYPYDVDFRKYKLEDENFIGSNYFALSPLRKDWII